MTSGPDRPGPARWRQRLRHPLLRLLAGFAWIAAVLFATQKLARWLVPPPRSAAASLAVNLAMMCVVYFAYRAFVRRTEQRAAGELDVRATGVAAESAAGAAAGVALIALTVGALWLAGAYHVQGTNGFTPLLRGLALSLPVALWEEVLLRGIVFRIAESWLGTLQALALSALLFGALHMFNPNASWYAAAAIALEAGVLLGAAYVYTRRLWLAIGIHFGWNFAQGGIFGVAISGNAFSGYLKSTTSGPAWLSGGAFGAEASVVALLVCTAAGAWLLWRARARGGWLQRGLPLPASGGT